MKDDEPRVELILNPQRAVFLFVVGSHLLAGITALFLPVDGWLRIATVGLVLVSLRYALAAHWQRRTPRAIHSLVWQSDGAWLLTDQRGNRNGELIDYYLGPRLVILKFRRHPAVLLYGDSVSADALRRLRMRLRHGRVDLAGGRHNRRENPEDG